MTDKKFPLTVEARTRSGISWDGAMSITPTEVTTYSYLTDIFSLASSSRPWNGGWQSNVAIAYWNLCGEQPKKISESRVAYSRTLLDDHGPLRSNNYVTTFEGQLNLQGGAISHYFQDDGLNCVTQQANVSLVVARPKWLTRQRHAIRHTLLISDFAKFPPRFFANGIPVENLPYCAEHPQIITVLDGNVLMGLRPLEITDYGRKCAVEIHRESDHYWISYWNYCGQSRLFSMEEFQSLQNGYAWIVEDSKKVTPTQLYERLSTANVKDVIDGIYRSVSYDDGSVQLEMKIHHLCPDPHLVKHDNLIYKCPVFSSKYVQGGAGRELIVGDACIENNPYPIFLRGDVGGDEYAVYNFERQPCSWRLRIGSQVFERKDMLFGAVRFMRKHDGTWHVAETKENN